MVVGLANFDGKNAMKGVLRVVCALPFISPVTMTKRNRNGWTAVPGRGKWASKLSAR